MPQTIQGIKVRKQLQLQNPPRRSKNTCKLRRGSKKTKRIQDGMDNKSIWKSGNTKIPIMLTKIQTNIDIIKHGDQKAFPNFK